MKKTVLYILPTILMLLAGCEKQIDMDVENEQPRVVVQSHNVEGKNVSITLTQSRPIFGYHPSNESSINSPFKPIDNATAFLQVGNATYPATQTDNKYTFSYQPQEGDKVQLSASVTGFGVVTASAYVPKAPRVGAIQVDNSSDEYAILIPLDDPAEDTNYYGISIIRIYSYRPELDSNGIVVGYEKCDTEYVWFHCEDPLFVESDLSTIFMDDPGTIPSFSGNKMLFDDSKINGLAHTIKLTSYSSLQGNQTSYGKNEYRVVVSSYSRDEYLYRKAFETKSDFDDVMDFFSEPVQIHSNVSGGIGLFGMRTERIFSL